MTGFRQLAQAIDAIRKAQAATSAPPEPASLKFVVFEDNGGGYGWTIVTATGEAVQSSGFASYEDAKQAARDVHAGAGSASFEHIAGDTPPIDLAARRATRRVRDASGARRPGRRAVAGRTRQLQQRGSDTMASATLIAPPERLAQTAKPDSSPALAAVRKEPAVIQP